MTLRQDIAGSRVCVCVCVCVRARVRTCKECPEFHVELGRREALRVYPRTLSPLCPSCPPSVGPGAVREKEFGHHCPLVPKHPPACLCARVCECETGGLEVRVQR